MLVDFYIGDEGIDKPGYATKVMLTWLVSSVKIIGSLSNDDADGNKNEKRAVGLLSKTTTLHVHHAFLDISLPSLHDYHMKLSNFTLCEGRKQATTIFFSLSQRKCGP